MFQFDHDAFQLLASNVAKINSLTYEIEGAHLRCMQLGLSCRWSRSQWQVASIGLAGSRTCLASRREFPSESLSIFSLNNEHRRGHGLDSLSLGSKLESAYKLLVQFMTQARVDPQGCFSHCLCQRDFEYMICYHLLMRTSPIPFHC